MNGEVVTKKCVSCGVEKPGEYMFATHPRVWCHKCAYDTGGVTVEKAGYKMSAGDKAVKLDGVGQALEMLRGSSVDARRVRTAQGEARKGEKCQTGE